MKATLKGTDMVSASTGSGPGDLMRMILYRNNFARDLLMLTG